MKLLNEKRKRNRINKNKKKLIELEILNNKNKIKKEEKNSFEENNIIDLKKEKRKQQNILSKNKFLEKEKLKKNKKQNHLEYLKKLKEIRNKYKNSEYLNPKECQKEMDELRKKYNKTKNNKNIENIHIQNISSKKWEKILFDHQNENKTYYKNHFAGNFDGPDSKRIDAEVSIAFKLYSARKENNRLCDAYASMAELEPFKEKYKNYKIKKVKKYCLRKK